MPEAIRNRQGREEQQCRDLNCVDRDIDRGRAVDAAKRDVGDREREDHGDHRHEDRSWNSRVNRVGRHAPDDVADHDAHRGDHDSRIDPVVQVRRPSDDELGDPGESISVGLAQEGLLGEQIRAAGTGIELGELRIRERRGVREQERDEDSRPHRDSRRIRLPGLENERYPQERTRRDQRHRVDCDPGEPQRGFHLGCFFCFGHISSLSFRR